MPRTPLIAANWKMNLPPEGWNKEISPYRFISGVDVVVFPTALDIPSCVAASLVTGGQSARADISGAFTGDVSMQMLAAKGCTYVLCGHSERRQHHQESDETIAAQVSAAVDAGLTPILCIGETADEREMGNAEDVVKRQLSVVLEKFSILNSLPGEASAKSGQFSIAYEPVWAIGTGKTATPADAQAMHAFIRSLLPTDSKEGMRILYGGSVKPASAPELIAQEDIDGFLVGGASLILADFAAIVASATS